MENLTDCPQCTSGNTYHDGVLYICPDCGYEWGGDAAAESTDGSDEQDGVFKDCNGNILVDGDSVLLIKDLKVKGSSITLKKGTKVKGIRLTGGDHDVDCRVDGMSVMLKSCFLKKA